MATPRPAGPPRPVAEQVAELRSRLRAGPADVLPRRLAEIVAEWPNDVRSERHATEQAADGVRAALHAPATSPAAAGRLPDLVAGLDLQWQAVSVRPAQAFDSLCGLAMSLVEPARPIPDDVRLSRARSLSEVLDRHWDSVNPSTAHDELVAKVRDCAAQFAVGWRNPGTAATEEFADLRRILHLDFETLVRSQAEGAERNGRRLAADLKTMKSTWRSGATSTAPAPQFETATGAS